MVCLGNRIFEYACSTAKKVTNVPLARVFVSLLISVYWICVMTGFDFWCVKENSVLLNLQCRPRCTVRTFNYLHAASLGIPYGLKRAWDYSKLNSLPPSAVFVIYCPVLLKVKYLFFIPMFSGCYPRQSFVKFQLVRDQLSL